MTKKKREKSEDLNDSAIIERAKSIGNGLMWAISLQYDRLLNPREQDRKFHPWGGIMFHEADVHFFGIVLTRLRDIATTLEHVDLCSGLIKQAITTFDSKLPWLKRLRDVFEHLEDYAIDSNLRKTDTSRRELQVWSTNGEKMNWLGYDIDWSVAYQAAGDLFEVVRKVNRDFFKKTPEDNTSAQGEEAG